MSDRNSPDDPSALPDSVKPVRQPRPHPETLQVLKVSAASPPHLVAGAIAGCIRQFGRAEVLAIGAGAVNKAVKSIAIAHGYMWEEFVEIVCVPSFVDVEVSSTERTAILFSIFRRQS